MKHLGFWGFTISALLLGVAPLAAQQCPPQFIMSVYDDAYVSADQSTVYGDTSIEDDSVLCYCTHSGYTTKAILLRPDGSVLAEADASGFYSSVSALTSTGQAGTYSAGGAGELFCDCAGEIEQPGPDAPVAVGDPTPTISSINPSTWVAGTTTSVTISGTGFGTSPSVSIGGQGVSWSVVSTSDTQISLSVTVDPGAPDQSNVPVTITSHGYSGNGFQQGQGQQSNQAQGQAQVQAAQPTITSISPAGIIVGGTTSITISGTNLAGASGITAQGITFTIQSTTATQVVASAAVAATDPGGTVSLTITVSGQTSAPQNIKKQVPSRLIRRDYPGAPNGVGPLQTPVNESVTDLNGNILLTAQCGVYRNYVYSLVDQDGTSISATFTLTEHFTNYTGPVGTPTDQSTMYGPGGVISDVQYFGGTYPQCLQPGDNEIMDQHHSVTFQSTNFPLTTVNHIARGNFMGTLRVDLTITTP